MSNTLNKWPNWTTRILAKNPWMKRTFLWPLWQKIFRPIYWKFNGIQMRRESRAYFKANAKRVEFVTNLFYDEESKRTFVEIINAMTSHKKFNIFHGVENQYFINNFFKYGKNEVLIDCGAFTGDTIENFLKLQDMEYDQIIAFEPGIGNYKILENKFGGGSDKFLLINKGVYSKNTKLYFSENGASGEVSEIPTGMKNEMEIEVMAIDSLTNIKKVTFIKMDIEGAEMDALEGAKETILRDKPRLAICIYHSNEDRLRIAEWIHNLVPEYKLYCRHHGNVFLSETVLYAQIIEEISE